MQVMRPYRVLRNLLLRVHSIFLPGVHLALAIKEQTLSEQRVRIRIQTHRKNALKRSKSDRKN